MKKTSVHSLLLPLLLLGCGGAAPAPGEAMSPEVKSSSQALEDISPACSAPVYRQFDFWRGRWKVEDPAGALAGNDTVRRIQDGCALQEEWAGAGGDTGTSLNFYDAATQKWHQTWIDSSGFVLHLDGGVEGDKMVLAGDHPRRSGTGTVRHRISWEPLPGRQVRQVWDFSLDGGATWQPAFDGLYSRR